MESTQLNQDIGLLTKDKIKNCLEKLLCNPQFYLSKIRFGND